MLQGILNLLGIFSSDTATSSTPNVTTIMTHPVVTNLMLYISPTIERPPTYVSNPQKRYRVSIELYSYKSKKAWLDVTYANEKDLSDEDLVVVDIQVGKSTSPPSSGDTWESRSGGIWVLRSRFSGKNDQAVTRVDVLFGTDVVDPRPSWELMPSSLQLDILPETPVARLSILRGHPKPRPDTQTPLRVEADGTFKIVQFSDAHMGTNKTCKDAIDANGEKLPEFDADPRTVELMGEILDEEKPNLAIISGDLLHHNICHSQSALFKLLAPIIEREISFTIVFGNHDDEGPHALSRKELMKLLQDVPFNLSEPGPVEVDGVGNFCIDVLGPAGLDVPVLTLYFLDSHGEIRPSWRWKPDYWPIKQSQIDWFAENSQARRRAREECNANRLHLSLVFQHIPLPEFRHRDLLIQSGQRGEPTEGPSVNTNFYAALAEEGAVVFSCGHDHVNDFCALLPQQTQQNNSETTHSGPWLCYGGAIGYGGYCSYGKEFYHRQARVLNLDMDAGSLTTWMRREYNKHQVDKLQLFPREPTVDLPREQGKQ